MSGSTPDLDTPPRALAPPLTAPGLAALIVAILLLVIAMSSLSLRSSRLLFEQRAQDAAENVSTSLGRTIAADINRIGTALHSVSIALEREGAVERLSPEVATRILSRHQELVPGVDRLFVADPNGRITASSLPFDQPADIADRDYFRQARDTPGSASIVSEPMQGRISKKWVITLSRRLVDTRGGFAGIVFATLGTEYFNQLFAPVDLGPKSAVAIRSGTLKMIARSTPSGEVPGVPGSGVASPQFLETYRNSPEHGAFVARNPLDGTERVNAYVRVTGYPLVAIAGLATEDYLAPWRREVWRVATLAMILTLLLGISATLLWRAWQNASRSAQQALRAADRHQALMRTASDGIHVLDRKGRLVEFSDSFAAMLGYRREEMIQMHVSKWDALEDEAALMRAMDEFVVGGRQEFSTVHRRQDGQLLNIEVVAVGVCIEGQELLYCAARDVTARHRAEQALRFSQALVARTARVARVGGWSLDIPTGDIAWSDETCRIHGVAPGHRPSLARALEFVPQAARAPIEAAIGAGMAHGHSWDMEHPLLTADGRAIWVRAVGEAEFNDGRPVRLLGTVQDITESEQRRRELAQEHALRTLAEQHAQELQGLLMERSDMLDVLTHEVRQPLNNASAALEAANSALIEAGDSMASARVVRAQVVLRQVQAGVDNTLATASLLARAGPIERPDADIDTLVAVSIGDMLAGDASRIRVERHTALRTASMDASLMRLALRNLLSNALKFSPPGTPVIVRLSDSDDPLALLIDVIDSGPGIDAQDLLHIFERGVRGRHPNRPAGLGLGLYIVRRVMELHGGSVLVVPGSGATVVRLVLEQSRDD